MICEVLASIELAARARDDIRFIPWPEILTKAPDATRKSVKPYLLSATNNDTVAPDAIFGIEYRRDGRNTYRFFALEADRGTMPLARSNNGQTSYLGKVAAYHEIIARQIHRIYLGVPNLLVLTVMANKPRVPDIIARLDSSAADSGAFLFKSLNASDLAIPTPRLLFEPWERAGHSPLRIGASN